MDPEMLAKMAKWMEMYQRVAGIFTPEQFQDFMRTCPPPTLTSPRAGSSKTTTPSPAPAKLTDKFPETAETTPDLTATAPTVAVAATSVETLRAESQEKQEQPVLASASPTTSVGKVSPQRTQATTPEPASEKVTGGESISAKVVTRVSGKEGDERDSDAETHEETEQRRSVGTPGRQTSKDEVMPDVEKTEKATPEEEMATEILGGLKNAGKQQQPEQSGEEESQKKKKKNPRLHQ
ncbi:hypothetical protein M569_17180 [Genlisea aurea]|uniref:Uncharacterized protein n=1 Tax=Genlisea aurea TaxID=192259 RepID=S8DE35_9LAMI|nr:hypothetical protein M569_17180 [Genlisea aurea]